ncbi:MAG: Hydrogenase nickel incorporation protein HypB [Chthonomonadaceae bacterium]|nr:Hydrogenase nickel incorporation protein HypB [Chthonomonadaceae bacterium]
MERMPERWTVEIGEAVLGHNIELAAKNRRQFQEAGVRAVSVVSSPGSGKTALLERTLLDLQDRLPIGVIVGDLETDNDARRLRGKGAPVVQITTGGYCHLEASMVARAVDKLDLSALRLLFIENVGNLVCPAAYDLGEESRVVLLSVTEGEDKPLKYPTIFRNADAVVIAKMDLAEAVGLDREALRSALRHAAPQAQVFELSSRTGAGMDAWYAFLGG